MAIPFCTVTDAAPMATVAADVTLASLPITTAPPLPSPDAVAPGPITTEQITLLVAPDPITTESSLVPLAPLPIAIVLAPLAIAFCMATEFKPLALASLPIAIELSPDAFALVPNVAASVPVAPAPFALDCVPDDALTP